MSYLGRMLFLLLFLWSAHQAWASIAFQRGHYAMEKNDIENAQMFFEQSIMQGFAWPDALFDYAYTFYLQAVDSSDPALIKEAVEKMQAARKKLPLHAKYLIYEARLLLRLMELGQTGIRWADVDSLLRQSYDLKGASLWIPYQMAKIYLTQMDFSSAEQQEQAYREIYKACDLVPSYYVEPALEFLIARKVPPSRLADWMPKNYEAFSRADSFLRSSGNWSYWKAFYPVFLEIKKQEKEKRLVLVSAEIQRGHPEKARELLLETQWIDEDALDLKVFEGLLQFQMKQLGRLEEEILTKHLKEFLEAGRTLGGFTEFARIFIHSLRMDYLQGLYAFSQGDYQAAAAAFDRSDQKSSRKRFFHAMSYVNLGKPERAAEILLPELEQTYTDIDLRNLALLEKVNPKLRGDIQNLKAKNEVTYRPVSAWAVRDGMLGYGKEQGMLLTLPPGSSELFLSARNLENAGFPSFAVVRLHGKYAGSFWIRNSQWRPFRIPVATEGGRFWLSVELMNHKDKGDAAQLGEVRIGPAA